MELREKVASAIANERFLRSGDDDYDCWPDHPHKDELLREADAVLAIPEISNALAFYQQRAVTNVRLTGNSSLNLRTKANPPA